MAKRTDNSTCALDATSVIVWHPECINCIISIIYEWGHGPGVSMGNNAECTVCMAGKGMKGKESLIETKMEQEKKEDQLPRSSTWP